MEAIKERMRKRDLYIKNARIFAECVINILSSSTILVFGSVSRGDFNEWSDIDILIITRDTIPQKPSERLDVIHECMRENPLVEPVIITLNEFYKLL
ncbi:MAG: nucleotidyltransferase domain-containing protein, partial [Sulfolobales archaeon]